MSERIEVGVYFETDQGLFPGKIDEWGDINVAGTTYIGYGGIKRTFVDKKGKGHLIKDIWIDARDFEEIVEALSQNEVELVSP